MRRLFSSDSPGLARFTQRKLFLLHCMICYLHSIRRTNKSFPTKPFGIIGILCTFVIELVYIILTSLYQNRQCNVFFLCPAKHIDIWTEFVFVKIDSKSELVFVLLDINIFLFGLHEWLLFYLVLCRCISVTLLLKYLCKFNY